MTTDFPQPKYHIGQRVFRAGVTQESAQYPCPDCLGQRQWQVSTPAGGELTCACPRCAPGYGQYPRNVPSLTYQKTAPMVQCLTIGSVRVDTYADAPVSYMCRETGVGSGSVHHENNLFALESDAQLQAEALAAAANTERQGGPEALQAYHFAQLTYRDAAVASADGERLEAWHDFGVLQYAIEDAIDEAGGRDSCVPANHLLHIVNKPRVLPPLIGRLLQAIQQALTTDCVAPLRDIASELPLRRGTGS